MELENFWFTEDGKYTFSKNGMVYRTSNATSSDDTFNAEINAIGQLNNNSYYFNSAWIDHSAAKHSIWAIISDIYYYYDYTNIYRFEDNDYSLMNVYNYTDYYIKDGIEHSVQANYIFANGEGNELCVIRNATDETAWSIEFIQVTD